ncbi:MAG: ATP-dependent RNA helicase HrpA, partial [Nocardioides sp.]
MRISYPDQLPVSQRRHDIATAIGEHQVIIVAGETGSGKTTQLPKICLELGRGRPTGVRARKAGGLIGHTQPRRIAARAVATRLAEELGTELGDLVGYQVRFTDKTSRSSRVKVMTDGILLAELPHDRLLRRYDTIILDEAHERSLNIDFLLGYLKRLLPRRPDLKLIITSATIDVERFAEHFADPAGTPAPIIEVSGRTFPVEVRYRPLVAGSGADDEDSEPMVRDQTEAIREAVRELLGASTSGDILVFLPGEREIRDAAEALSATTARLSKPGRQVEVVPLYARLTTAEQQRVFSSHPESVRRVVLATNVAETSLTVPGITSVIDTGMARISRYSVRTKVQRLPIEPVSQASARQRSGRCGRVAAGIAIRLYAEEDFAARPEFTTPEILRTNLASVILRMAALGLISGGPGSGGSAPARAGDVASFGFLDPPDKRAIAAGIQLLEELGALTSQHRLTKLGRRLAKLPIDPRIGRMIIE